MPPGGPGSECRPSVAPRNPHLSPITYHLSPITYAAASRPAARIPLLLKSPQRIPVLLNLRNMLKQTKPKQTRQQTLRKWQVLRPFQRALLSRLRSFQSRPQLKVEPINTTADTRQVVLVATSPLKEKRRKGEKEGKKQGQKTRNRTGKWYSLPPDRLRAFTYSTGAPSIVKLAACRHGV